jgi:hypothetical protein
MTHAWKFLWSVCLGLCLCACDGTYNEPAISSYTYINVGGHTAGHPVVVDREFNRHWIDDIVDDFSLTREVYMNDRNAMVEITNCAPPKPSLNAKLVFVSISSGQQKSTIYAKYKLNWLLNLNARLGEFGKVNLFINEVERPVYLVLLAHNTSHTLWLLHLAKAAKIERIVLFGEPNYAGRRSSVVNVPGGVPVQVLDYFKCGLKPASRPATPAELTAWGERRTPDKNWTQEGAESAYSKFVSKMQTYFPALSRSDIYAFGSALHVLIGSAPPEPDKRIAYEGIDPSSFYVTSPGVVFLTEWQKWLRFFFGSRDQSGVR